MADEGQKQEIGDGVSNPNEGEDKEENLVQVDRAELERLQQEAKRIETLDGYAKEAQAENAEAYFNLLEDTVFSSESSSKEGEKETSGGNKEETVAKAKIEEKEEKSSQPAALTKEQQAAITQAQQAANNALLQVQLAEFQREQSLLPEGEQSPAKKEDLLKVITGPESGVVVNLAKSKYDGNVFKAANYIHLINEGVTIARKEGAKSEAAKLSAAASAAAPPNSGRVKPPEEAKTPEEKAKEINKKLADEIAPATEYVMPQ